MAHIITLGPHPDIVLMDIIENLEYADMMADEELGLNEGKPLYVMLDVSKMIVGLPEKFLEGARQSFFINDNLIHMSMHVESNVLRTLANMVAKVTNRKNKLSLHDSREKAIAHLLGLIEGEQSSSIAS